MDDLDKKIFDKLKEKEVAPIRCQYVIDKALKDDKKIKHFKFSKIVKAVVTSLTGVLLATGGVFAATTVYENIWKKPKIYNSYEEYQEELEKQGAEYQASTVVTDDDIEKVESEEQARQKASEVMELLGFDSSKIKTVELKKNYIENAELVYVVRTKQQNQGIEVVINAETGKFEWFLNNDMMYNYNSINPDKIDEEKAKEYSNDIYKKLGYKEGVFVLENIKEGRNSFRNQSVDEWTVEFYKKGRYINNKLDYIVLSFVVENGNVKVNNFMHKKIANYDYQDNDIEIKKEKAIKIAREQDRKITDRKIIDESVTLDIGIMNSFAYLQEQSHGTDDGRREAKDGENSVIYYNTYEESEKIARNAWIVEIKYKEIEQYSIDDIKSTFNRVYYVDATTGEIIGGCWGNDTEEQ